MPMPVRLLTASLLELISEGVAEFRLAAKGEFGRAANHIGKFATAVFRGVGQ